MVFGALKPRVVEVLVVSTMICGSIASVTRAAEIVRLHTNFFPDRLGASTTISFGFDIANSDGGLLSPVTHISLSMPAGLNYLTSTLGTASCRPEVLIEKGIDGCPPNSRLGFGSAYAEVPFGSSLAGETAAVRAVMGSPRSGNVVVLFYVQGYQPVWAPLVFEGDLLPALPPYGETLSTPVPVIRGVPDGPPVSILRVSSTIGPKHLTYYMHRHGQLVAYHPRGVGLPKKCPSGGFQFAAQFAFADASEVTAKSAVPCPHSRHHK